ncbi:FAD-dependent monooxygenase [Palleronia caenipelagi]|uniref:UbiH/UbiF family hydroxylase n=1 Tax=Palleronia caenipelagi TaxID=2489174 RepID=A0A547Q5S2_9RHOB|nr:FAD-dependent monooxygenase [Palleronia caenipelagi]TRD21742.1 UbiH/UbiF family hydroxylase [Palleronia caenipelagi]
MADTDIFISGAGIAGMVLAAVMASRGRSVVICDPSPPPKTMDADGSDLRCTAYLAPSVELMDGAGLWAPLEPHATPLEALRVRDSEGWPPVETAQRTFLPGDLGLSAFGQNVVNWEARLHICEALAGMPNMDLRLGTGFRNMVARDTDVTVTLSDGSRFTAGLVVGADGRDSAVREALGIGVKRLTYRQRALAFACTHELPHDRISTETYNSGGAFVTVPLPDQDGQPASSIVWMDRGSRIRELVAMEEDAFNAALTNRALHGLGQMRRITPLAPWPIVTQTADRLIDRRVALVAEAAHVMPPIGAQGLNTSLADIRALADAIGDGDPGDPASLERYATSRARDIHLRSRTIDLYNRLCRSDAAPLRKARQVGLKAMHDLAPLRRKIMQAGMGGSL